MEELHLNPSSQFRNRSTNHREGVIRIVPHILLVVKVLSIPGHT